MLARLPAGTGPTAVVQTSDQPPQTFGESLRTAAKVFSGTDSANDGSSKTARHQKSTPADANAVLAALLPKPLRVEQQPSWINPILLPTQLPLGGSITSLNVPAAAARATTNDAAAVPFSGIESKTTPPRVVQSEIGLPQTSIVSRAKTQSTMESVVPVSQGADNHSHGTASAVPASHDEAVSSALQSATNLRGAVTNVIPSSFSNAVPNADANVAADAAPSAVPTAGHSSVVNRAQNWIENVALSGIPNVLLSADPVAVVHAVANPSADLVSAPSATIVTGPPAKLVANVSAGAVADAVPNALSGAIHSTVAKALQSQFPNAALNGIVNSAVPAPLMHAAVSASAKQNPAPAAVPVSNGPSTPSVAAPDQSGFVTGLSGPDAPADQLVALVQPGLESRLTLAAGISSPGPAATARSAATDAPNTKDAIKDPTNNATGFNPPTSFASGLAGSQGGSQSGDQSQAGNSAQGQNAAPVQMNFASHPVAAIDHTQSAPLLTPLQTAPTLAASGGHAAKAPDAAPASTPVLQPLPVVNTAKLIQSAGQSEMRVGIRSNEFGNISISTSSTREMISAQISLDHGELARTLTAHLPEMQARLGSNQAVDVRIDMNGQGAGQGQGASAGMSNGSAGDGSREDRQQRSSTVSTQAVGVVERQLPSTALDEAVNTRLDIRA